MVVRSDLELDWPDGSLLVACGAEARDRLGGRSRKTAFVSQSRSESHIEKNTEKTVQKSESLFVDIEEDRRCEEREPPQKKTCTGSGDGMRRNKLPPQKDPDIFLHDCKFDTSDVCKYEEDELEKIREKIDELAGKIKPGIGGHKFVEVEGEDKRYEALQQAMAEVARRNPGSIAIIELIESYSKQIHSGMK